MSRAFVKEEERDEAPLTPLRPPLPEGEVNYVTPRGLELLRDEKRALLEEIVNESDPGRENVLRRRLVGLSLRIVNAQTVYPLPKPWDRVRFGATVGVRLTYPDSAAREEEFTLVGVDEADPATQRISIFAPLAQVLMGKQVGEPGTLETERGTAKLEVLSIRYQG